MGIRKILNFGHTFAHAYEATLDIQKNLTMERQLYWVLKQLQNLVYQIIF